MLLVIILSNTLIGIGYVLLSAWVGVGMCVVAIARDSVSYFINSKRKEEDKNKITKMDWVLLTIWITAILVITMFTQNGFWTWFAFFGTLGYTISIWQKNVLVYKYLGAFVCVFWIIYNINEKNFFGIVLEVILLVIVIVGLVTYYKPKKQKLLKLS